jgi:hypothetical protein
MGMISKNLLTFGIAFCMVIVSSFAGDISKQVVPAPTTQQDLFRGNEVDFETYFLMIQGQKGSHFIQDLGGAVGLEYFFNKYFGIEADNALMESNHNWRTYDQLLGSIVARYPIEKWHLAPYVMASGGGVWAKAYAHGQGRTGIGMEYRFTPNVGLFVDSTYGFNNAPMNDAMTRFGTRIAF